MRHYKVIRQTNMKTKGFTLVETLFSLLLISLAILLITRIIICALDGHKKSQIRFKTLQEIEFCKNQLLSKPFDSVELEEGSYSKEENHFKMKWIIKSITPTLKIIDLWVSYRGLTKRAYFYRSQYIKNNQVTEEKND